MSKTKQMTRRAVLGGGALAVVGGAGFAANWYNIFADASTDGAFTAEQAHDKATRGEIYLVDIRRPDEWARSGVAAPAIPIDMRRKDFTVVLQSVFESSGYRPVALICARGVRSDRMNASLLAAGFSDITDVPEGMMGSGAGPGWIAKGLPLRQATQTELSGQIAV